MATPAPSSPGAGLAPLVEPRPSEMRGLPEAVRAVLRELEADADTFKQRGTLLGWKVTMDNAWKVANRLRVDIYVGGPQDFTVSTT